MLRSCSRGDTYNSMYVLYLLIIPLYHIFHRCSNVDYFISSGELVRTEWIFLPPADSLFPRDQVRHQVYSILDQFSSVQSLSCVRLFATPWMAAHQASLSITNSQSLLKLMPIESVMPSRHLIYCRPLLLLPPIPPSIRVFSKESTLRMRWTKYWSFSFSISPSNEHPGLSSFRMDWLDLLAAQGTLKSLLQHHSSKASIFRHSAFNSCYYSTNSPISQSSNIERFYNPQYFFQI